MWDVTTNAAPKDGLSHQEPLLRRHSHQQSAPHHIGPERQSSSGDREFQRHVTSDELRVFSNSWLSRAFDSVPLSRIPLLIPHSHIIICTSDPPTWASRFPTFQLPSPTMRSRTFLEEYHEIINSGGANDDYASLFTSNGEFSMNGKKAKATKGILRSHPLAPHSFQPAFPLPIPTPRRNLLQLSLPASYDTSPSPSRPCFSTPISPSPQTSPQSHPTVIPTPPPTPPTPHPLITLPRAHAPRLSPSPPPPMIHGAAPHAHHHRHGAGCCLGACNGGRGGQDGEVSYSL